jgi:hypothetical protein
MPSAPQIGALWHPTEVSRAAQGPCEHLLGLGKILLVAAMKKFLEIFSMAGGIGLFIDAKDHEAKAFYEHFGFVPLPSNELQLFLPVVTIQEALALRFRGNRVGPMLRHRGSQEQLHRNKP